MQLTNINQYLANPCGNSPRPYRGYRYGDFPYLANESLYSLIRLMVSKAGFVKYLSHAKANNEFISNPPVMQTFNIYCIANDNIKVIIFRMINAQVLWLSPNYQSFLTDVCSVCIYAFQCQTNCVSNRQTKNITSAYSWFLNNKSMSSIKVLVLLTTYYIR